MTPKIPYKPPLGCNILPYSYPKLLRNGVPRSVQQLLSLSLSLTSILVLLSADHILTFRHRDQVSHCQNFYWEVFTL